MKKKPRLLKCPDDYHDCGYSAVCFEVHVAFKKWHYLKNCTFMTMHLATIFFN